MSLKQNSTFSRPVDRTRRRRRFRPDVVRRVVRRSNEMSENVKISGQGHERGRSRLPRPSGHLRRPYSEGSRVR